VTIYRDEANRVLADCAAYREGRLSLADLKSSIWRSTDVIVSTEERGLRDFLQSAEAQ
jgi:hypothetical protein